MILLASMTFYGFWRPEFLLVIALSAITDFVVARCIDASSDKKVRLRWLMISLTINLGLLAYFKYLFFFVDNAIVTLNLIGFQNLHSPALSIILPLGISFYTFQTISYSIDVYRKVIKAEKDFVLYGCFVTFFPQLVAGPILRGGELLGQLSCRPEFRIKFFISGLRRILFGLFLKVVLADNLSPLVDFGFGLQLVDVSAVDVVTLAFLFGFQIYFDFSAYSHIAIGSARLMGITFPENFNFPYMASSPREFWRRWHISLSSWIRDYLYLPLTGAKSLTRSIDGMSIDAREYHQNKRRSYTPLFVTWAVMGFWHGANWTFVFWGLVHATCVAVHRLVSAPASRLPRLMRVWGGWAINLPVMMLAWIPFRAQSVEVAFEMYGKLFCPEEWLYLGMRENTYLVAAFLLGLVTLSFYVYESSERWFRGRRWMRFSAEVLVISFVTSLVFVFLRPINQFIYFQF
ncbi:MAG: MBOAT family O-acyltransferase [Burkholderiales bacterium]|nr:MBOAT family O-acyltransferase [Burkholderiales bacterium]